MPSSEFSIIEEFFAINSAQGMMPTLGIGDDCAVLDIPSDKQLAVSTDTLVEDVHFLSNSDPRLLGHKALAVNLSDIAAMGATPTWVSLAITLPAIDKGWLSSFSQGFFALAKEHSVQIIGGDTTRGPLSITVNIMGLLPNGQCLARSGAKVGDAIYVSGTIGNAGLGLKKAIKADVDQKDPDVGSYLKPEPCVSLGEAILSMANSCIDVSDGLSADLNHILKASHVGATISHEDMPFTQSVKEYMEENNDDLWPYSTGDDYQLCFTMPPQTSISELATYDVTKIGVIEEKQGLRIKFNDGKLITLNKGFDHFQPVSGELGISTAE
ncbi:MAG: thiamine-phosphate kinase [Cycloclasticus sp.]|nr:MAG: thiamine-phosphate kinase [Cycloclasticus sp.]